ncbi:GAF and ANTAR domain-containing protein [Geodermatophilus poikilotrophus]|uniref:GAF domain-containing protein n=1 Tax=Geodermatophilus poikilotrophus TaxID=1333667 RepID=A0A1I0DWP1_9ACTN|nr:GAF and ANTAR domain-containing protein [Geodermatophilus poikilotrophus]SET37105.1 GAF domain-containing protein [Geodermatophilus poikilotrophus]
MTGPVDRSSPRARAALDELGRLLLAELTSPSVLQRIVDLVAQAMPAGVEVSITLVRGEQPTTAAFTGQLAEELDETQYERGYGPCLEAAVGGLFTEITDARTENRWPEYVPLFLDGGAFSALAAPVPAAQLTAALNVYARTARAFTDDDRSALVQFAAYAGAALTNMDALQDARDLAENLQKAMEFRSVIEQAKGILIERHKLTADQAFRLLTEASMHTNRKVRDVAEDLVLTGELTITPPTRRPTPPRGS